MKLNHLIAATALAALASGTALAQGGSGSPPSSAANTAQSALGGVKDKAKDEKNAKSGQSSKDMKGTANNPITVTPPSQDDPNARVNVDTDPADANAAAGQSGVSADANLHGPNTTAQNGKPSVKPITDKLKKTEKNSDHK